MLLERVECWPKQLFVIIGERSLSFAAVFRDVMQRFPRKAAKETNANVNISEFPYTSPLRWEKFQPTCASHVRLQSDQVIKEEFISCDGSFLPNYLGLPVVVKKKGKPQFCQFPTTFLKIKRQQRKRTLLYFRQRSFICNPFLHRCRFRDKDKQSTKFC